MITKIIMPIAGAAYFIHAALGIIDNAATAIDQDAQFGAAMLAGHAPQHAGVGVYADHVVKGLAGGMPPNWGGLGKGTGRGRGPALPGPMPGRRGPSGRPQGRR